MPKLVPIGVVPTFVDKRVAKLIDPTLGAVEVGTSLGVKPVGLPRKMETMAKFMTIGVMPLSVDKYVATPISDASERKPIGFVPLPPAGSKPVPRHGYGNERVEPYWDLDLDSKWAVPWNGNRDPGRADSPWEPRAKQGDAFGAKRQTGLVPLDPPPEGKSGQGRDKQ